MSKIRVGFSSDWNIKGNNVGFGTINPTASLHVVDTLKADFNVTGVTTLTAYGGFVAQNQHVNKSSTIGFATVGVGTLTEYYETETGFTDLGGVHHGDDQYFNTLSEDLVIDDGQILNITNTEMVGFTTIGEYDPHTHASYVCAGSLEQVSVTNHFSVPNGGTNDRQEIPIEGTVRFNTDLNTLEFFNGVEWRQFTYNQGQSGRGLFAGGYDFTSPGQDTRKNIDYVQIATLGNALNFGDLQQVKRLTGGCSSEIRGLFMGGITPSTINDIDHVTIASAGNAVDFGNLAQARYANASLSSSTRGITAGGVAPSLVDQMDYVEIATSGNALDFGDIADSAYAPVGLSNGTRGLFCGGEAPTNTPAGYSTYIYSITIASKGNGIEFGHLRYKVYGAGGGSNSVRGIYAGGGMPGDVSNINYITLSTEGNAIDFGNLTEKKRSLCGTASQTRVVLSGGVLGPTGKVNTIEYVNIASSGNGFDFGDLNRLIEQQSACSDSHGGLGGF